MHEVVKRKLVRTRYEAPEPRTPWWLAVALGGFATIALMAAAGIGGLFYFYNALAEGYVPIDSKITDRFAGLTTVYDRGGPDGGAYLGSIANPDAQLLNAVPLDQISPWVIAATVSTEDNTFWTNPGVNPKGIARAAWENYTGGGIGTGSGGSSITQQLVKVVYLTDDCSIVDGRRACVAPRTLDRKLKELVYSFELSNDISKDQILNYYLNQISYADRYVGIEAAAQGYFRKPAKDLTLAEAALLAGIPSSPTQYHPRLNCVRGDDGACVADDQGRTTVGGDAKTRQEDVLRLMVEHGRATQAQVDEALLEPLLIYPPASTVQAAAWIDNQVEPRLQRMCEAGMLPMTPGTKDCAESVRNGGYRVTSTLDWGETQKATLMMQTAIQAGLANGCECHNAAIATIEPATGQIMVYAPNIDPTWTSDPRVSGQIDQLTEINLPGSSFKPAVYLGYMDKLNKVPLSSIWDTSPLVFYDKGSQTEVTIVNPRPGGGGEGLITVRAALGGSQNVPAFRAASAEGVDSVIAYAKQLGITTLQQQFDPTFYSHEAIYYGPSIATGGANVRAIDMAYMNATISNMGYMVGVPTLAKTLDMDNLKSIAGAKGDDLAEAMQEKLDFQHGMTRLPGTRKLDPVVVLKVESIDGKTLYEHGADLQKVAVVDPESVWLLQSIMTDCNARFIIWQCGRNNDDLSLDPFMADGTKIPTGVKTGTQQGYQSAKDTLATWMNGYTRYAATAIWVGNADKSLVRDGAAGNYASANTTVRLFKHWMGQYHDDLQAKGVFEEPADWAEMRPADVAYIPYQTATTEKGRRGGCNQMIEGWVRIDVPHLGDCGGQGFIPLPDLRPDLAQAIARAKGIPTRGGGGGGTVTSGPTPQPMAPTSTPVPRATTTPTAVPRQPTMGPQTPVPATASPPPPPPAATRVPATATPPPAATTQANDDGGQRGRGASRHGR